MATTKIKIKRGVYLKNIPQSLKTKIHRDLCVLNKKYEEAMKYGRYIPPNTPSHFYFYAKKKEKDIFWVPRGYIYTVRQWLKQRRIPSKVYDYTLKREWDFGDFKGRLKKYQANAAKDVLTKYPIGVLQAMTGSGKTVIALYIIAKRKQSTLVIVHSKDLLYQWAEEAEKFLGAQVGLVGDGNFDIQPLTIGIINSVRNNVKKLTSHFGQVIIDECHRAGSSTWYQTLQRFPARHFLGLSATPYRNDGLTRIVYASIGPKLHEVPENVLINTKAVLTPKIVRVPTQFWYPFNPKKYAQMISALTMDDERNTLIVNTIERDLSIYNNKILVTSDRVGHCIELQRMLEARGIKSEVLSGEIPKGERSWIVDKVKKGDCKVLIATTQLIGEGFDCPKLTALFLTTPIKFKGRVIQTIGRVLRPEKGKQPRVYDFRDNLITPLKYSGYHRDRVYKEQWQ